MEHKIARSFGIIPIYEDYNGYKVLVVQNAKGGHWGFPKGTPEEGETPMQTAMRELQEETGITENDIRIETAPEFIQEHLFEKNGMTYNKVNTYWAGFVTEQIVGENLDEIIEARWVTPDEAKVLFNLPSLTDTTNKLEEYLEGLQEYNW